jgi:hypothetical protein
MSTISVREPGPAVKSLMLALNYPQVNVEAAWQRFLECGTVAGAPVEPCDVAVIDNACESDDVERWRQEPLGPRTPTTARSRGRRGRTTGGGS